MLADDSFKVGTKRVKVDKREWCESIWNKWSSQSKGVAILFKKTSDVNIQNVLQYSEGRLISVSTKYSDDYTSENHRTNVYAPTLTVRENIFKNETEKMLKNIDT